MMRIPDKYTGKWRIFHMDQWDRAYIDMEVPGHITIQKDGIGYFQFGLVTGEIDCRVAKYNGRERLEFSWVGADEGDEISGRGWAEVDNKEMVGWIYIYSPRRRLRIQSKENMKSDHSIKPTRNNDGAVWQSPAVAPLSLGVQPCEKAGDSDMRIFVTGVSCIGKTTIGSILASRLGYHFFDLDQEIESFFGTSIKRLRNRFLTDYSYSSEEDV